MSLSLIYDYFSPPPRPQQQQQQHQSSSPPPSSSKSRSPAPSPPPLVSPSFSQRLHAACHSPTASLHHHFAESSSSSNNNNNHPDIIFSLMRRELDHTKQDLARAQVDAVRLEERVKMLERTLKETREMLKNREGEVEKMRREIVKEREQHNIKERRRSDAGLLHAHSGQSLAGVNRYPGGSLDTRLAASDLAQRLKSRDGSPAPSLGGGGNQKDASSPVMPKLLDVDEERARARVQETYLSRVDSWSGAQVLQAVHDLNSEILQFAASAVESCTFITPSSTSTTTPQTPNTSSTRMNQSLNDTSSRLGPTMTRLLHIRNHASDPLLVQLALQSSLALCTARALSSFIIGLPSKSDLLLSQIYSEMQRGEEQPVFKKWRALTERYVGVFYPTLREYSVGEVADTMVRWCADVLSVSGCVFSARSPMPNGSSSNNTSSASSAQPSPSSSPPTTFTTPRSINPHHHHHHISPQAHLRAHHHDQLKRIAQRILRIASITREEILSTSFEIVIADPSAQAQPQAQQSFEKEFGAEMVDAFGEYTSESKGRLLGTVELGLRCVTKVGERREGAGTGGANGVGPGSAGKDGGELKLESRLLLRPKVVLESVLEVLDR